MARTNCHCTQDAGNLAHLNSKGTLLLAAVLAALAMCLMMAACSGSDADSSSSAQDSGGVPQDYEWFGNADVGYVALPSDWKDASEGELNRALGEVDGVKVMVGYWLAEDAAPNMLSRYDYDQHGGKRFEKGSINGREFFVLGSTPESDNRMSTTYYIDKDGESAIFYIMYPENADVDCDSIMKYYSATKKEQKGEHPGITDLETVKPDNSETPSESPSTGFKLVPKDGDSLMSSSTANFAIENGQYFAISALSSGSFDAALTTKDGGMVILMSGDPSMADYVKDGSFDANAFIDDMIMAFKSLGMTDSLSKGTATIAGVEMPYVSFNMNAFYEGSDMVMLMFAVMSTPNDGGIVALAGKDEQTALSYADRIEKISDSSTLPESAASSSASPSPSAPAPANSGGAVGYDSKAMGNEVVGFVSVPSWWENVDTYQERGLSHAGSLANSESEVGPIVAVTLQGSMVG